MCLTNNKEDVQQFLKSRRKRFKVYKVVDVVNGDKLKSIWYNHTWKQGWNKSSSRSTKPCLKDKYVHAGIHVYLTEQKTEFGKIHKYRVGLELTVYKEDLIGVNQGDGEAVFRKAYLTKKAIKKAIKEYKERNEPQYI